MVVQRLDRGPDLVFAELAVEQLTVSVRVYCGRERSPICSMVLSAKSVFPKGVRLGRAQLL